MVRGFAALGTLALSCAACAALPGFGAGSACGPAPAALEPVLACELGGPFAISSVERRCGDGDSSHAREIVAAYAMTIARGDRPFAAVDLEQSTAERYSGHKFSYLETLHLAAERGLEKKSMRGVDTFTTKDAAASDEILSVLLAERARTIATVRFAPDRSKDSPRRRRELLRRFAACFGEEDPAPADASR